jgi:hypothetical protein
VVTLHGCTVTTEHLIRKGGVFDAGSGGHVTPERVEEEAGQLRPQELSASLATGAEVSFDCSLSLLTQRRGRLGPLGDPRFC